MLEHEGRLGTEVVGNVSRRRMVEYLKIYHPATVISEKSRPDLNK